MTTYSELARIRARLTREPVPGEAELGELAAGLPSAVPDRAESAVVLAWLYERLGSYRGEPGWPSWPSWRSAGLPARVQVAWLRAEIVNEPAVIRREPCGELLYQALRQVSIAEVSHPDRLVAEAAAVADPVVQTEALRLAREGLHAACLSPALVRRHLVGLLASDDDEVVASALDELAEPWAALDSLPAGVFSRFLLPDAAADRPRVADAALSAAVRHAHRELLREVVDSPGLASALRRRAMELLGDLADGADIRALTAVAAQDPLLFGTPFVACLHGLHRRGHFVADREVPTVLAIALADHTIPADRIMTVLYTGRHAAFRTLTDAPAADPTWPRRLDLLVALHAQGVGDMPVGEAVTRMLTRAADPVPFLAAIRRLRHAEAEDAVIGLLPSAPAAALDALEAIGGRRTVAALRTGLGLDAFDDADAAEPGGADRGADLLGGVGVIAPHLRADRNTALEILWHLTRDLGQRHALLDRLDPADLPRRIAADLGGPDERELVLLRSHLDPGKPVAALCRLAESGGVGTVAIIADLLARIVAELAVSGEAGDPGWRLDSEAQSGEPVVPEEVVKAIRGLGRRLHARQKIRPVCLLDAPTPEAAGDALVAAIALDVLERPGIAASQQAILLELLTRVPSVGVRHRIHRLLRHPDRHVRKHAIELLARDAAKSAAANNRAANNRAAGSHAATAPDNDAEALSATLIRLTTSHDAPTVRQALLALGRAEARWAGAAVAACLDHPTMNIKKTAAEVLITTGTPAAVPKLLFWLGRHDNPGFRAALGQALHATLGEAYAATVIAAAEAETDERSRRLLLSGLDGELAAALIRALANQGSTVVQPLQALASTQEIMTSEAAERAEADNAARALLAARWDSSLALQIATMKCLPQPNLLNQLRPRLPDWLRLAASEPAVRDRLPSLFAAPRSDDDPSMLADFTPVLLKGLAHARGEHRSWFTAVLTAVAPHLSDVEKLDVVDAVRVLPPAEAAYEPTEPAASTLALLRSCDAVLILADVEQALAEARLQPDPSRAEAAVLREAFTSMRTVEADSASRDRLHTLIEDFASAGTETRTDLLHQMLAVQPLDVPSWTIAETALAPSSAPRIPQDSDLDQPRSAAQRARLLAMLASPERERRDAAARALRDWPEIETRIAVLRPYLRGEIAEFLGGDLARAVRTLSEAELRADGVLHDRVIRAASRPQPGDADLLIPLLLEWWQQDPAAGDSVASFLRRAGVDYVAEIVSSRLDAGEWGFARLLVGGPLLRTPALTKVIERLRAEGQAALADSITFTDGPLRGPDAKQHDAAALAALRDHSQVPASPEPPSREELFDLARSGRPEQVRRALLRLGEMQTASRAEQDPEIRDLLAELLSHPKPRVRLQAHRTARQLLDRPTYLRHTSLLLTDPHPDVVGIALRSVSHAAWEPAIPAMVALLEHSHPAVRAEAAAGLVRIGPPAADALRHAVDHARPDKRAGYRAVLEQIEAAATQP